MRNRRKIQRVRHCKPIFPVNAFTPRCSCPHRPGTGLAEGDYCPNCHRIRDLDEKYAAMDDRSDKAQLDQKLKSKHKKLTRKQLRAIKFNSKD